VSIRPMLASATLRLPTGDAFDRAYSTNWALEEKLDGHRCIIRVHRDEIEAWSRPQPGKGGVGLTRAIPPAMKATLRSLPSGDYDGELVAASGKAWDVVRKNTHLVFVAFDCLRFVDIDMTGQPYDKRRGALLDALAKLPPNQDTVSTVFSRTPSWADVQAIWARGGEGAILKRRDSLYHPGARSSEWLKLKTTLPATLKIVGFEAGKSGPYSALRLVGADGVETTVKVLTDELRRAITQDPTAHVGRQVVIHFQERTPSGTYRHGRFDHFAGPAEVIPFAPRRS